MKRFFFLLALAVGMAIFSGCGPTRYTVTDQPAVPYYARPAAPGAGYIWVDGDWYWRGGRYAYRNGYWTRPRGHRVWVTGTWMHTPHGYYWRRGYWKR